MILTVTKIKSLSSPGKYFDGKGLYLHVQKTGSKYWRFKYRFEGRERLMALGVYPDVTLAQARAELEKARVSIQKGADPGTIKKQKKHAEKISSNNTFRAVALDWLDHKKGGWEPITKTRIQSSLETHIFPMLGDRPIDNIKAPELVAAIKKIEAKGAGETADRVLQRCRAVYRYAMHHGRITSNPMSDMLPSEILRPREKKHRLALPQSEVPNFRLALSSYGEPVTAAALKLLILTAVRPGELRGAQWPEFEDGSRIWRIPPDRMKMKTEHIVPLSRQACELVAFLKTQKRSEQFVFPSPFYPTQPISENTLSSALARMGYKNVATPHGFRSLFSTVANEHEWDADVIERQLAHLERDQVRAAYHHAQYLKKRQELMQWWANWFERAGTEAGNEKKEAEEEIWSL
jgi:integrase